MRAGAPHAERRCGKSVDRSMSGVLPQACGECDEVTVAGPCQLSLTSAQLSLTGVGDGGGFVVIATWSPIKRCPPHRRSAQSTISLAIADADSTSGLGDVDAALVNHSRTPSRPEPSVHSGGFDSIYYCW